MRELLFKIASLVLVLLPAVTALGAGGSAADRLRAAYDAFHVQVTTGSADALKTRQLHEELLNAERAYVAEAPVKSEASAQAVAPSWADEVYDIDGSLLKTHDLWTRFRGWVTGAHRPTEQDMAFRFVPTSKNSARFLPGNEAYWPVLEAAVSGARSSINIQVFGVTPDKWVWDFAKLLVKKAHEGVKVRLLADKLGARMYPFEGKAPTLGWAPYFLERQGRKTNPPSSSLFEFLRENGVETVLIPEKFDSTLVHADHRKYFVIDGLVGFNTGYTLQQEMHDIKYDEGLEVRGPAVDQMQLSFFANWVLAGGQVDASDWSGFVSKYFPSAGLTAGETVAGSTPLALRFNIPNVRYDITDAIYAAIAGAKHDIYLVSPYFASGVIDRELEAAAKRGVRVKIVVPKVPVDDYYGVDNAYIFSLFAPLGIQGYWYRGPKNYGLIHAKGVVADGRFVTIGSCNLDPFSLFYNSEQNFVSDDPALAMNVKTGMFDDIVRYSDLDQPPADPSARRALELKGRAVEAARALLENIE